MFTFRNYFIFSIFYNDYKKLSLILLCFFFTVNKIYSQSTPSTNFFKQPINLNLQNLNNYDNFNYIDSSISNSRMIFLGESSHTTKEYSLIKYKLIKYLHEKHGFNIVLFESGLADCLFANKLKNMKDSAWIMQHSIFPIWWSKPVLGLMNYIKSSQITLGGFDYKASSTANSDFLKLNIPVDTFLLKELYKYDTMFYNFANKNQLFLDSNSPNYNQYLTLKIDLENLYKRFSKELDSNKIKIDTIDFLYYKRIILNKLFFIQNLGNSERLYKSRDSIMSNNILWFCDTLYKNQKIVIWGANEHIAKHRSDLGNFYAASILPEKIKRESYFIGLYAYSGEMYSYPDNFTIKTPKKNSLEERIKKLTVSNEDVFIDFKHNYKTKDFEWLNKKTITYHWGKLKTLIIPIDYYDGVILINRVSLSRKFDTK